MSKYKVGDRVRVKEGLMVDGIYDDGCIFVEEMAKTIGSTGRIKEVNRSIFYEYDDECHLDNPLRDKYHLDNPLRDKYYIEFDDYYDFGCGYDYVYSNSMLEPLGLEPSKAKTGTKRPEVEIYYYDEYNCPYYDLEFLGIKSLIIAEPYVIVTNRVNDKQYLSICHPDDEFDPDKGFDVCLCKRAIDELEEMLKDEEKAMERIKERMKDIKDKIKGEKEYLRKM